MQAHVAATPLNARLNQKKFPNNIKMNVMAVVGVAGVFIGCCSNVYYLERLVKEDPGSGNLVTFAQFLFIAIVGFIFTARFGTATRKIPFKSYLMLVIFFFLTSLANNYAFDFNIPMPLHMIFRAGSLMANMVMGIVILKKKYTFLKYLSVFMITAGIIICTVQSGSDVKGHGHEKRTAEENEALQATDIFWWIVGISILTFALFLSARMGIFQETLYARHGKHPWEALFYAHTIPLPLFLLLGPNLWHHWVLSGETPPMEDFFGIPTARYYLLGNVITQWMCIGSVYVLTTECSSLTVTLTVTLRKFISLIFSILYFRNPFTLAHWTGTLLVFLGTMIFTEMLQKFVVFLLPEKKKAKTS